MSPLGIFYGQKFKMADETTGKSHSSDTASANLLRRLKNTAFSVCNSYRLIVKHKISQKASKIGVIIIQLKKSPISLAITREIIVRFS